MTPRCPEPQKLAAYAHGELTDPTASEIADHVEHCDRCEATVVGLERQGDTVVSGLRKQPAADPLFDEPQCQRAIDLVRELGRDPATVDLVGAGGSPVPAARTDVQLREYKLLEKLGEGGMGAVYKAMHTKLKRIVALKVLPAERLQDPHALARFEREMEAVGKLDHQHIVRAMDAGEWNGTHFLVMEYVDGVDLSQLVKQRGPLPIAEACELIHQAAVGLQHAHEHGLVHRDIKPSNLMLTASGERKLPETASSQETSSASIAAHNQGAYAPRSPTVKILDLGLALLSDKQAEGSPRELTGTGQMMGTLDYMAPEQGSDSHIVDIRADIYSLGATLYKLLTGEVIYSGERYKTPVQKMMALATQPAPDVRTRRQDVPESLAQIIARMLEKDPAKRPATPAEVAALLAPYSVVGRISNPSADSLATHIQGADAPRSPAKPPIAKAPAAKLENAPRVDLPPVITAKPQHPGKPQAAAFAPARGNSPPWLLIGGLLALVALGIVGLAATVFYFQTASGTLRVEVQGRETEVRIQGTDIVITAEGEKQPIKLSAGEHSLVVTRGDFTFETEKFELKRGENSSVKVELLPGKVQVVRDGTIIGDAVTEVAPRSLAGRWQSGTGGGQNDFGAILLTASGDGYVGTYAATYNGKPGTIDIKSTGDNEFAGDWSESDGKRKGTFKLMLAGDRQTLRVEWEAADDELTRGNPAAKRGVGTWQRVASPLADSGQPIVKSSVADTPTIVPDALRPVADNAPLSPIALVTRPQKLKGVQSWTIETARNRSWVGDVVFSPDGKFLASGGLDGAIRIWDVPSQELVRILIGHQSDIGALAWPDEANVLVSASQYEICVWEPQTGKRLRNIAVRHNFRPTIAVTRDASIVASGGDSDRLRVFSVGDGKLMGVYDVHPFTLEWSADDKRLLGGHRYDAVWVWNRETKSVETTIDGRGPTRWSPDGKQILMKKKHKHGIVRYDLESKSIVEEFTEPEEAYDLAWLPDSSGYVTGGIEGLFAVSFADKSPRRLHGGYETSVAAHPKSAYIASGNRRGFVGLRSVKALDEDPIVLDRGQELQVPDFTGMAVACAPQSSLIAVGQGHSEERSVSVWDVRGQEPVRRLATGGDPADVISWSPDAKRFFVAHAYGHTHNGVYDAQSGKLSFTTFDEQYQEGPGCAVWSPDGATLVLGHRSGMLILRNATTGEIKRKRDVLEGEYGDYRGAVTWLPGTATVVLSTYDDRDVFWDTEADTVVERKLGTRSRPSLSADGKLYASTGENGPFIASTRSWDILARRTLRARQVAWLGDSNTLLAVGYDADNQPTLWHLNGKTLQTLKSFPGILPGEFRGDGTLLVSRVGNAFHAWNTATGRPLSTFVRIKIGNDIILSPDGHHRPCGIDDELRYVALLDDGTQQIFTAAQFEQRFGWKNDPAQVPLTSAEAKPTDETSTTGAAYDHFSIGKWMPAFLTPESFRGAVNATSENGAITVSDGIARDNAEHALKAKNVIARAKIRGPGCIHVRCNQSGSYVAWFNDDSLVGLNQVIGGKVTTYGQRTLQRKPDEFHELALAIVDFRLMVFVDGRRYIDIDDDKIREAGPIAIQAHQSRAEFKDVEVMSLDGLKVQDLLPERDPLAKHVGVWDVEWTHTLAGRPGVKQKGVMVVAHTELANFYSATSSMEDGSGSLYIYQYRPEEDAIRTWTFFSNGFSEVFDKQIDPTTGDHIVPPRQRDSGDGGVQTGRLHIIDNDSSEVRFVTTSPDGKVLAESIGLQRRRDPRKPGTRPSIAADGPAKETPELAVLQPFAGRWDVDVNVKPSRHAPDGSSEKMLDEIHWALGGRFLMGEGFTAEGRLASVWVWSYDPKTKTYPMTIFQSTGDVATWNNVWDPNTKALEGIAQGLPEGWAGVGGNRIVDENQSDVWVTIKDERGELLFDMTATKTRK